MSVWYFYILSSKNAQNRNVLRISGKRGCHFNDAAPFLYPLTTYFHPRLAAAQPDDAVNLAGRVVAAPRVNRLSAQDLRFNGLECFGW
jgi:hypothetical protein